VDVAPAIEVQALGSRFLDDIVGIHLDGLGYTLNSRLGPEHLKFLYQTMAEDPGCYVGVALVGGVPAGVVSGTVDADRLKSRVIKSTTLRQRLSIAGAFILRPGLLVEWAKESVIGERLFYEGEQIVATLTTLSVDSRFRNRGVGHELVRALERFLSGRKVLSYRLETLVRNEAARDFYTTLGFKVAGRRAGSYVLVKGIAQ
jgi:ribosomal protein S18 acetylase RimI-like enzyme